MKTPRRLPLSIATFVAGLTLAWPVWAQETQPPVTDGAGGAESEEQAQQMPGEVNAKSEKKSDPKAEKKNAQQALTPHGVMIESALMSAMDQLKGLKTGVKTNQQSIPPQEYVSHFKMFGKEINSDLKTADAHLNELNNSVQKYPSVASSDDYEKFNSSFNELKSMNASWQAKMGNSEYWNSKNVVLKDLDQYEKQLNQALDKAKDFNSNQLDVSSIG